MVGFNNIHFVTNVEKNRRNEPFLITEKFMGFFFKTIFNSMEQSD
jgi:hypothetical protein